MINLLEICKAIFLQFLTQFDTRPYFNKRKNIPSILLIIFLIHVGLEAMLESGTIYIYVWLFCAIYWLLRMNFFEVKKEIS